MIASKPIAFEHVTRGFGKVYIAIGTPDDLEGCHVIAESSTMAGNPLPVRLTRWKHGGHLTLVVPEIGEIQRCSVSIVSATGETIARAWRLVHPVTAHVESAVNSARQNIAAQQILDCDERPDTDGCTIRIERIVSTVSGEFIVKGAVSLTGPEPAAVIGDLDIRVLGGDGANALVRPLITLRDSTGPHPDYPGCAQRTVSFSARINGKTRRLVIWTVSTGSGKTLGFRSLTPSMLSSYKRDWANLSASADEGGRYDLWYRTQHAVGSGELALQAVQALSQTPLFSLIVPIHGAPTAHLESTIESVLRQSYANFELILVNNVPEGEEPPAHLGKPHPHDERLIEVRLAGNPDEADAVNEGIRTAQGDFVCFLDQGDLLADDALFRYAKAVNDYPDTDLFYSDEDTYDGGRYIAPRFKPDWNPDLLLATNYVGHFLCIRAEVLQEASAATSEFNGAQGYHLALCASERARNVYHERRILYHHRPCPDPPAGAGAPASDSDAGQRALEAHLQRQGVKATVRRLEGLPDAHEVAYVLEGRPLVSIIIPNKNSRSLLDRCIKSVMEKTTYDNFEIIIVENNSDELGIFEYYEELQAGNGRARVVLHEGAFNYSRINNLGAQHARGEYLVLLNNDTEVKTPDWIERMLGLCMREGTGVVGAKLLYPDETIQHAGVVITNDVPFHLNMHRDNREPGYRGSLQMRQDCSAVTGACLMTRRSVFEQLGGLDERFPVDYNDIDYCLAARDAGYLVVFDPHTELYHYESASRGFHQTWESKLSFSEALGLLRSKWPRYFTGADPMGNPNFEQSGIWAAYHHGRL